MMKLFSSLALIAAILGAPASAMEYTVMTCAELADVDDTLVTSLVIGSSPFACDEYTRFRVRNSMTLTAAVPGLIEFSNFSLRVLGDLTVEPDVSFTGVEDQLLNGGVLNVRDGASATFMGTATFNDNSVRIRQIDCGPDGCPTVARGVSYNVKKGGAIHNRGLLTFRGDAAFARNEARTDDSIEQNFGGAISNTGPGTILFEGTLTMEENDADGNFEGFGGAIYNRGNIVVSGESSFTNNQASNGGAIFQTPIGTTTFNAMVTFFDNTAVDLRGGGIFNDGGVVEVNAGSLFEENEASSSGDGGIGGAIHNQDGGLITLTGSTIFRGNVALAGGAINTDAGDEEEGTDDATTIFPDDTQFIDNEADFCPNVRNGDDSNCSDV